LGFREQARVEIEMVSPWQEKWERILSKYETCTRECIFDYKSDARCRDSLEAVLADVWNLKDWLANDDSVALTRDDLHAFLETPEAFHIRGCADVETRNKHLTVDDPRREDTRLVLEANHSHPSGLPVVFSARRLYKGSASYDEWEDAVEMARRAIEEWQAFLSSKGPMMAGDRT
jgi:hypothetical protein